MFLRVRVLFSLVFYFYFARFRATVRIALLDMVRKPSERGYHDPAQPMNIITGMGNNSKDGEAVIKVRIDLYEKKEEANFGFEMTYFFSHLQLPIELPLFLF